VAIAEGCKGGIDSRQLEGMDNVGNASQNVVGLAGGWHADMG